MILYLLIITFASLIISLSVNVYSSISFFTVFGLTWIAIVAVLLIDAITATIARLLPAKLANHEKKFFQVSAKEKKFYEKLKIRKWKDAIPEIGQFTGFRKNTLQDPKSVEYVDRFLLETCYGEIGHTASVFTGFLILLLFFLTPLWWGISIPVAVINAILNLPSLFILRYNSYKLEILRKSNLKRQQANQQTKQEN